jgi:hypothetical protein
MLHHPVLVPYLRDPDSMPEHSETTIIAGLHNSVTQVSDFTVFSAVLARELVKDLDLADR